MRNQLIHLSRCRGITRKILSQFIQKKEHFEDLYNISVSTLQEGLHTNYERSINIMRDLHNEDLVNRIQEDLRNYQIITIIDSNYPESLKSINDPPLILYLQGNSKLLLRKNSLSVIGSRKPSVHAYEKTRRIVAPLVSAGFTIVSGMAAGIDTFGHRVTLQNKGDTIAILGSGFERIYPRENQSLFRNICINGLVVSEYPPHLGPRKYHFPERNRIISGLTFGTVVIEAKQQSGTLITVRKALVQGKEVYALPDSILSDYSTGCHELIKDGAKLVTGPEDIIEDWIDFGLIQAGMMDGRG